jgi:hypothetical protein
MQECYYHLHKLVAKGFCLWFMALKITGDLDLYIVCNSKNRKQNK